MVEDMKIMRTLLSRNVCVKCVFVSGFYTFLSLARSLLTSHISRSCLTTSLHIFVGCSLTKLPPTSNFQYILDQKLSSIFFQLFSSLSIFKMFKKQAHSSQFSFTNLGNDEIGKIDGSYFKMCLTFELSVVEELFQKMMHKHN